MINVNVCNDLVECWAGKLAAPCHPCEHRHNYAIHSPVSHQAQPSPDFSASTCQSCVLPLSLTV